MIHHIVARLPHHDAVQTVVAPPYDALSPRQRYTFAQAHPDNFLSVILSPEDVPPPAPDPRAHGQRSRERLQALLERFYGPRLDPSLYIYELSGGGHRQRGVVGALRAADAGRVLGHEQVLPHRVAALKAFYAGTRINTSPVSITFRPHPPARQAIAAAATGPPFIEYVAEDVTHRIWKVSDASVMDALQGVDRWYITDGHHRIAAAMAGAPEANVLVVAFPSVDLRILGYHRVVNVQPPAGFMEALAEDWDITEHTSPVVTARGVIGLRFGGRWYRLARRSARPDDPVAGLDVSLLHDEIVGEVLAVRDPAEIRYLVGDDPAQAIAGAVDAEGGIGFLLQAPSIDDVMAVADAERTLPAKSTWFTPKVRSGLFVVAR